LVRRVGEWAYANEQPLRTLLRLSLDPATDIRRPGHRREWIAEALATVRSRMDLKTYTRLATSLMLLLGIDPVVVMKDIARASREQALDALEWAARTLVERAQDEKDQPLVAAAAALVRGGRQPTVSDAAEAAEISRATAYRYFPTQEMLLAEVALFAVGGPVRSQMEQIESELFLSLPAIRLGEHESPLCPGFRCRQGHGMARVHYHSQGLLLRNWSYGSDAPAGPRATTSPP